MFVKNIKLSVQNENLTYKTHILNRYLDIFRYFHLIYNMYRSMFVKDYLYILIGKILI